MEEDSHGVEEEEATNLTGTGKTNQATLINGVRRDSESPQLKSGEIGQSLLNLARTNLKSLELFSQVL